MKKCILLFFVGIATMLSSCSNNDDDGPGNGMYWDFVNASFAFAVTDEEGELVEDLSLFDEISVTYKGTVYDEIILDTRANKPMTLGLRVLDFYEDEDENQEPAKYLTFGEFSPEKNYKGEEFTVKWFDGTTDKIKFDFYITWDKDKMPTVHKALYLNGVEHTGVITHKIRR